MPFQKQTVGPAILRQASQGDENPAELAIRKKEQVREGLVKATRDHAEGKISTEKHDRILRHAHYRLNDEDDGPF